MEHAYTIGCPGCESIQLSSNVRRGHNEECRSRMERELSETGRAVRAKDRIDGKVAQMGEQVIPHTHTYGFRSVRRTFMHFSGRTWRPSRRKWSPLAPSKVCVCACACACACACVRVLTTLSPSPSSTSLRAPNHRVCTQIVKDEMFAKEPLFCSQWGGISSCA